MGHPSPTAPPSPTSPPPTAGSSTGGGSPAAGSAPATSATSKAAAEAKARQIADTQATFLAMLSQYQAATGMVLDKHVMNLMHNAAKHLVSTDRFIQMLSHTASFHKAFPGIFEKGGRLRTDPSTYIRTRGDLARGAAAAGVPLNEKTLDKLMINQVDPQLAQQRFAVEASYQNNKQSLDAYNQELKAMGHKPMGKAEMTKFIMGQASPAFYNLYNQWQTRMTAQAAGYSMAAPVKNKKGKVIGYSNDTDTQLYLTRAEQAQLSGQLNEGRLGSAGGSTADQIGSGLARMAADFRTAFPESQRQNMGISHDDLFQLEFGGPRQASIQAKVEQIMNNTRAEANQQYLGTETNLGQRGRTLR